MRQGLLSEPKASSGPAAMLLAVSRSPSSIPRRSPCPDRCHLLLASLYTSASQTPDSIHPRTGATFLWRPSIHPPLKLPTASTHGPMPPSSGVPRPHPILKTSKTSSTASTPEPMPPSSGVPLSIPHTDRFHLSLASLYISNKTKNPRRLANTTLPDTREKRTNVKRIFTIHFATCS